MTLNQYCDPRGNSYIKRAGVIFVPKPKNILVLFKVLSLIASTAFVFIAI